MSVDLNQVGILVRREIEARIVAPFYQALARELGSDRATAITDEIIYGLARQAGEDLAKAMGGNSLAHFLDSLKYWTKDDALQVEILEQSETVLNFNVQRCRYADMYREVGIANLGRHLSCGRDFALIHGFNPQIRLIRTQTIMDGAEFCDFRYRLG